MQHEDQQVIAVFDAAEHSADQWRGGQIECGAAFVEQEPIDRRRSAVEIHAAERQRRRRIDALSRLPRHRHECGSQRVVPAHDFGKRSLQDVDAELAAEAYGRDDVVGGTALRGQLRDEPQTMLRRRERLIASARPSDRRADFGRVALAGQQLEKGVAMQPQRVAEVLGQCHCVAACTQLTVFERQGHATRSAFVEQREQISIHLTILSVAVRRKSPDNTLTGTPAGTLPSDIA